MLNWKLIRSFACWLFVSGAAGSVCDADEIPPAGRLAPVEFRAGESEASKGFWSFVPPKASTPPTVTRPDWPRKEMDRYVLAALESKGLAPVKDADPRTLVRRLGFDLTGLPPDPALVDRYVEAPTRGALERIIDDLLASPRFGERWGRHWLDVARYAESTGKERNYAFPEAWRYRDWVIAAVNADLPYDEFIRRQVAGDLLPARSVEERDANVIATGFLAVGPKGLNERLREQFVMDVVDEQLDVTMRSVMGVTVACARCHDHKFDPFTQHDYYALAGIFRSSQTLYGTMGEQGNRHPSSLLTLGQPMPAVPEEGVVRNPPDREKVKRSRRETRQAVLRRNRPEPELPLPPMPSPELSRAMGVREGRPVDCHLLVRGEVSQRGDRVPRGFVEVLNTASPPSIPSRASGRLELAAWLTRPENPLTARVLVNRTWRHLFGRGLVRTADDFGALGERPTHPELLDHLAIRFREGGGSLKSLIREIVLSRTYQLGYGVNDLAMEVDPENTLLWRSSLRRLDAEAIRDAMLQVSGTLDLEPPMGSPVSKLGDGRVGRGMGGLRDDVVRRKRSVYLPVIRGFVPESLELFDFAEPSLVIADRDTTNVPSQALYLLNNPEVLEMARSFAKRLLADAGMSPRQRVDRAYRLALGRPPTSAELTRAIEFLRDELTRTPSSMGPGRPRNRGAMLPGELVWTMFSQALLASAEFRFLR
jgi:hypothetical protein